MSNHETKCPTCYGPVDAAGHAITMGSAFVEIAKLQNQLDLMRDEFTRIRNIASHPLSVISREVVGICDRAVSDITQRVSVIDQRDKAISARDAAIEREAGLREALNCPGITSGNADAIAWHFEQGHPYGGVSRDALCAWLRSVAGDYRRLSAALSTPGPTLASVRAEAVCPKLEGYADEHAAGGSPQSPPAACLRGECEHIKGGR